MFTTNQLIFALFFVVAFVAITIYSYRKDKKRDKGYFKGSFWILVGFLVFVGLLIAVKVYLKG